MANYSGITKSWDSKLGCWFDKKHCHLFASLLSEKLGSPASVKIEKAGAKGEKLEYRIRIMSIGEYWWPEGSDDASWDNELDRVLSVARGETPPRSKLMEGRI